jgi:hypothetical protein
VLAPASLYAKCAPKHVLKIVMTADFAGAAANDFVKTPKTLYRSGETLGRIEEAKNPETGMHLLMVVNEPDLWMVDLSDMTGQHAVDPGPSLVFRAPILNNIKSKYWNNFEFGCEVPFMNAVGSKPVETENGGRLYTHAHEGVTAKLFVDKNDIPQRVELVSPDIEFAVAYRSFEELRDAPADLFAKPAGVTFVEANETPSEPEP